MSKIAEIRGKYPQILLLNQLELHALKKEMEKFRQQDLKNLDDYKLFLEILKEYRSVVAGFGNLNGEKYQATINNILSVGEDGIYSKKGRFIYELIQNVDDCDYTNPEDAELDIHFDLNTGTIVLTYNETGFTPFNVFAITGIAEAAKNTTADKIEIGEKGIGFKSVFGVADKVLIQSGYFSFYLTKEEYTIPQPYYPEEFCHVQGTRLALYVGDVAAKEIYDELVSSYQNKNILLNQNPVLFLNKLTDLCFYIDKSFHYIKFHVDRHKPANVGMGLLVEENVRLSFECCDRHINHYEPVSSEMQCIRYTKPITYTREMFQSRYEREIEHGKTMYLSILFPEVDYACHEKKGRLYSFLPTEITLNVPLICHIPFKLNISRESLDSQGENAWFMHSVSEFSKMLKAVYQDLAKRLKENVIAYLPAESEYIFETRKLTCLRKAELKGETFLKLPVFYTTQNHLKSIDDIVRFSPDEEIGDPQKIHHLLGIAQELFMLPENLKRRNYGITKITGVAQKLFHRAMCCSELTDEILCVLCGMKNVVYAEFVNGLKQTTFDIAQIRAILKYEKCCRAFNAVGTDKIKAVQRMEYHASVPSSEMVDVRGAFDETIEADDFGANAEKYLHRISFRCIQLDDIRDKDFLICENVLVLSKSIESLKEFCKELDDDDLLTARLQFRTASKMLDEADDDMLPVEYLKLLRKVRKNSADQNMQNRYIALINESGMNEKRFINELLQNADDAEYPEDAEPEFDLRIDGTQLKTSYNEKGFTKNDVRSITAIGESTKKSLLSSENDTPTGEKGIGFKSVFRVADSVEIRSGQFGFSLTADQPTIPKMLEDYTPVETGTEMTFQLKMSFADNDFSQKEVLRLCLCLRKLKRIHLGKYDVMIEDGKKKRNIRINQEVFEFTKIVYTFKPDEKALQERRRENQNIPEDQCIIIYVPNNKLQNKYYVYSVLPTEVECNIPLVIDAPFVLTTSREQIVQSEWNRCIKNKVCWAILRVISVLKETDGIKVLRFLKVEQEFGAYSLNLFSDSYLNGIPLIERLKEMQFLPTYRINYYAVSSAVYKVPRVVEFLMEKGAWAGFYGQKSLKCGSDEYNSKLNVLGIKDMPVSNVMQIITEKYMRYMTEKKFRELLYAYLTEFTDKLKQHSDMIRSLRLIPVRGKTVDSIEFVAYSDKIYFKDGAEVSPSNCWLLDTKLMSVEKFDKLFGVRIKEYDEIYQIEDYKKELDLILNRVKGWTEERIYEYFLKEYHDNYSILSKCLDMLKNRLFLIPLKNELGELCRGKIYVSDMPAGYYFGQLLPKHIAHPECMELARFLGCKDIVDVQYEDLRIVDMLCEDDIENLKELQNGSMIIEKAYKNGYISESLIKECKLVGYIDPESAFDETILNEYVDFNSPSSKQRFQQYMKKILNNKMQIERREVTRIVPYIIDSNGKKFSFSYQIRREATIHWYYDRENKSCFCQMCNQAKDKKYIEVNNLQRNPRFYWNECGVSLCLICSKRFLIFRRDDNLYLKFYQKLRETDIMVNHPIIIPIGNANITFVQKHLAEIQEILRYEEEIEGGIVNDEE